MDICMDMHMDICVDLCNGYVWLIPLLFTWNYHIIYQLAIVVQPLSHVWLFVSPWAAAHQAFLFFTISQNLLKLMFIELVMLSNHLILCLPLLLLPSIFPSVTVFSNESALCIRWPKCWSFSFGISPSYDKDEQDFLSKNFLVKCSHLSKFSPSYTE